MPGRTNEPASLTVEAFMKVAEVTAFGGPEVLRPADRPEPRPADGEAVVRIRAAAVNPTDLMVRASRPPYMPQLKPPFVPGWDLAGEVTAAGHGVQDFSPGQHVIGMIPFGHIGGKLGAYAQAASLRPEWLAPVADQDCLDEAATIPLNTLTAQQALHLLNLQPGATVLITGASGGVGGFATQLAAAAGLQVTAIASRGDEQWVHTLGATTVLPRDTDLSQIEPVDAVLDAAALGPPLRRGACGPAARLCSSALPTRTPPTVTCTSSSCSSSPTRPCCGKPRRNSAPAPCEPVSLPPCR
jgi:NADPH:quinone reductase-like Zn-dependent oxidoreductase